jgi:hypothetical protein
MANFVEKSFTFKDNFELICTVDFRLYLFDPRSQKYVTIALYSSKA